MVNIESARTPLGQAGDLLIDIWDRHTPGWRRRNEIETPMAPDAQKKLVDQLRQVTDAPTDDAPLGVDFDAGLDQLAIQRMVPKRKGNWWLLPKDLKVD